MRLRKIVKIGGSYDIRLESADLKDFKWKEGSLIDIDDCHEIKDNE
jgi:hypothetical protein